MSVFPRLAPTDGEMSLTAHLPARVCGTLCSSMIVYGRGHLLEFAVW